MDIKAKVEELVNKITGDEALRAKFEMDPVSALEELIGVDLPNDQVEQLVSGVMAKLTAENMGGMLLGGFGGLFGKK